MSRRYRDACRSGERLWRLVRYVFYGERMRAPFNDNYGSIDEPTFVFPDRFGRSTAKSAVGAN